MLQVTNRVFTDSKQTIIFFIVSIGAISYNLSCLILLTDTLHKFCIVLLSWNLLVIVANFVCSFCFILDFVLSKVVRW